MHGKNLEVADGVVSALAPHARTMLFVAVDVENTHKPPERWGGLDRWDCANWAWAEEGHLGEARAHATKHGGLLLDHGMFAHIRVDRAHESVESTTE
eukprot:scaffold20738_cov29-Tisochrysis_lutea.AAC.1